MRPGFGTEKGMPGEHDDILALRRAIASMRSRIDKLLTGGEKRELLKLISRGVIRTVNDLKAYLSRVETVKSKRTKEQTCKLVGRVIDAYSRRNLPMVTVRIQGTSYQEDTDNAGVFIWEGMVKGKQYVIDCSKRGYKLVQYQYRATFDDEQNIVIKMAPVNRNRRDKKKGML